MLANTGEVPPVQAGAGTVNPSSGSVVDGPLTQYVWAAFLIEQLDAMGASVPLTLNNVDNIVRWMVAEEPPSTWWNRNNPLNASLGTSAADGTGSYPNLSAAANYTAKMILQSNMNGILKALEANAPPEVFSASVVASPWASSHYGGDPKHISSISPPASSSPGNISKYLPADAGAAVPVGPLPIQPFGNVNVPNPLSWAAGLETVLGDLTSSSWWKRVGLFTLGVVFIFTGIVLFVSTTQTGQKVESEAAVAAVAA
jgi:hypothetical protein